MEYYATTVQNKMSKIQSSLLELNSEILTGVRYLMCLKEDAAEIVKNLNCIATPATYLQEFMNVNSFILKYLSFLTEVNCKFEILNISEKKFKSSFSSSKAIGSIEISEVLDRSDFSYKGKEHLMDRRDKDAVIIDEPPSESDTNVNAVEPLQAKALRKKITKKAVKVLASKNKSTYTSKSAPLNLVSCNSNNENINHIENDKDCTSHLEGIDECYLNLKSGSDISDKQVSDAEDVFNFTKLPPAPGGMESEFICEKFINKENVEDLSCFATDDTKNITEEKIACSDIQSHEGIPESEVLPTNTQTSNLEVSNDASSIESTGDKKSTQHSNLEDEKAGEDYIKPEELSRTLGKEYDVIIEYIKSPSEFYVSLNDKRSGLLELEKMLRLVPSNKPKVSSKKIESKKALLKKEIGNYALFYSRCDEMWCRVKIINWYLNMNDNFVTVFLLDYGETKCVSVDDLSQMPECVKKFPAFIHRCHLQGIIPLDMEEKNDTFSWDKASSEKMKSLTENSKTVKIRIGENDCFHPPTSLPVTLWLSDDNECVNQLLVESKYALWSSNQPVVKSEVQDSHSVENEKLKNWNPMKEDFESYLNTYDLDMNDPAATIYGYCGRDYERICQHYAKNGSCFKGIACRKEHKKLDPLGFTTDEEEVYRNAFNMLPSPATKSVLNVRVTYLVKFNHFFCIPEGNSLASCEDLQSLLDCMNSVENIRDMKKLLIPPSAGQIVIAQYSEDQCWYRARILESQPEKDMYNVFFVDYGNKETVPLSCIRAVEPRYLHLPFQAMQCFIFGVNLNPKATLTDVMNYLYRKIKEGHITIEVIACLPPGDYINLLVNVFDQKGRNIGKDLIEMEYAVKKEEMVISSESESVPG